MIGNINIDFRRTLKNHNNFEYDVEIYLKKTFKGYTVEKTALTNVKNKKYHHLLKDNGECLCPGVPDFVVYNDKEIIFCEAKGHRGRLRMTQLFWMFKHSSEYKTMVIWEGVEIETLKGYFPEHADYIESIGYLNY